MRNLLLIGFVLLLAVPAFALTVSYGWEDGGTVLAYYPTGGMVCTNVQAPDPVFSGTSSLKCQDALASGTPQAYVAWVKGLVTGDVVYASFWAYDITPAGAPSCRIWCHYNDSPTDIMTYSGAGVGVGNVYPAGTGWTKDIATDYAIAVPTGVPAGTHTGIVFEVRTYTNPGDIVWIDEMTIVAPDYATIIVPQGQSPVESATWTSIKALYR
jgi:hypothetical protein